MWNNSKLWAGLVLAAWIALTGAGAAEFHSGKVIKLDGEFNDVVFLSGGQLVITAKVADDIFASGGELNFTGASADHVITAGGQLTFTDAQIKTIVATGGHIILDKTQVSNDVIIAGGEIHIDEGSNVASTAVIAGGEITIDGKIGGDATIRGGQITINGEITGNADLAAHEIHLGPHAVIGGNLKHRTADLVVSPGAQIKGQITAIPLNEKELKAKAASFILVASVIGLLILCGMALSVLVVAGVFAGHMQATDRAIRGKIFSTLGIGVLVAIGMPILIVVFAATVVGLPLAFLLIAFYLAVQPLAFASVAHATGMAIRGGFSGGRSDTVPGALGRVAYALLGLAIIVVLGIIPVVGKLVWVVVCILGPGASVRELFRVLARSEATTA